MSHDLDLRVYADVHLFTCLMDHFQERVYINSLKNRARNQYSETRKIVFGSYAVKLYVPVVLGKHRE